MRGSVRLKTLVVDRVEVVHMNKDGKILSKKVLGNSKVHRFLRFLGLAHDSITVNGMAACAALIGNVSGAPAAFNYVGVGTSTVVDASTDTWLGSAIAGGVQSATSITRVTTTVANDTLQLVYTFGSGAGGGSLTGTNTVDEVIVSNGTGTTNSSASGNHICLLHKSGSNYGTADVCNWAQGDTLQITVKVKVEQGA